MNGKLLMFGFELGEIFGEASPALSESLSEQQHQDLTTSRRFLNT